QFLWRDFSGEPKTDRSIWFGVEDVPAFCLAAWEATRPGLLVIRVNLNGQAFAGEDVLGEQWQVAAAGEPHFANALARGRVEHRRQRGPPPRLLDIFAVELHARRLPASRCRMGSITVAMAS